MNEIISQGWQCPICKRVNAPWVNSCPCNSITYHISTNTTSLEFSTCDHEWRYDGLEENRFHFTCKKCGAKKYEGMPNFPIEVVWGNY